MTFFFSDKIAKFWHKMDKFLKRAVGTPKSTDLVAELQTGEPKSKQRKYDNDYIAYGFTESGPSGDLPLCVVCLQTLSNDAIKPAKLKRHLTTLHSDLANKPREYFEKQRPVLETERQITANVSENEKSLGASYLVALRVAKVKKLHT